jgi:hypothetical protein
MKKIFENAIWWSGVVTVGLILGISLQFVRAWTEPTEAPPGGNVGAPINTGANIQTKGVWGDITKMGDLLIWGVLEALVVKTDYIQNSSLPTAASGYVLTLDDPVTGRVSWKLPTGGGSGEHGSATFPSSGAWTPPAGVNKVTLYMIGGGGGGAGGDELSGAWGTSGSAGAVKTFTDVSVIPGKTYTITVGAGGGNGSPDGYGTQNGESGTDTLFKLNSTILQSAAAGGGGWGHNLPAYNNGTSYGSGGAGGGPGSGGASGQPGFAQITW